MSYRPLPMIIRCLLLLVIGLLSFPPLAACKRLEHRRDQPAEDAAPTLAERVEIYRALQPTVSDQRGWTDTDRCDALLWASLRAASGVTVDVTAAQDPEDPGRWFRRPVDLPECFATGESKSTISRDMLLGVLWWAWTARRSDVVGDLWDFAREREGVMGDGEFGGLETLLNVNMFGLLGRLCVKTEACDATASVSAAIPLTYQSPNPTGFERHLEVLQITLGGELDGAISTQAVERLRRHASEQPLNPLFAAALVLYDGWSPGEVEVRLDPWPPDRLPTTADWCSDWRTEVEEGSSGSQPCPNEGRTHSGGELLFLGRLLRGPTP